MSLKRVGKRSLKCCGTKTLELGVRGCGSVGRPVTSDTKGLQLESSHLQNFIMLTVGKMEIKKKRGRKLPIWAAEAV